jgi:hypothetical protein
MKKTFKYYDIILAVFAAILLISNLAGTKLIAFGPIITDGGAILFPISYILGDVLTEIYGYKYARRAIWVGLGVMLLAVLCFTIVRYMPPAPEYTAQASYEAVLGFFPRIVAASLAAFLTGSFLNSFVLAKLKVKTKGKKLWLRLIGSTVVGELCDTVVFAFVAFGGILQGMNMVTYILIGWIFKTVVEIVFLPITYRVIDKMKQIGKVDAYDDKTNFTPFSVDLK